MSYFIQMGAFGLCQFNLVFDGSHPQVHLHRKIIPKTNRILISRQNQMASVLVRKEFTMNGYCLKCRAHREMQEPEEVTLKNGRLATRGKCGECGTTMFRMGGTTVKG